MPDKLKPWKTPAIRESMRLNLAGGGMRVLPRNVSTASEKVVQMTIQEAAKAAVDVQDACNLSGVVRTFAQVTETVWEAARAEGHGTDWVNHHPICQLFANKIADLAGADGYSIDHYSTAYAECKRLAGL